MWPSNSFHILKAMDGRSRMENISLCLWKKYLCEENAWRLYLIHARWVATTSDRLGSTTAACKYFENADVIVCLIPELNDRFPLEWFHVPL